jgi:hypothetical protein
MAESGGVAVLIVPTDVSGVHVKDQRSTVRRARPVILPNEDERDRAVTPPQYGSA